jgi:hypothetical protein
MGRQESSLLTQIFAWLSEKLTDLFSWQGSKGLGERTPPKMVHQDGGQHEGPVPFLKGCIIILKV